MRGRRGAIAGGGAWPVGTRHEADAAAAASGEGDGKGGGEELWCR